MPEPGQTPAPKNPSARQREEELFDAARKLRWSSARAEFLERECAGDPALRARLEGLLAADAEAGDFFAEGETALDRDAAETRLAARSDELSPDASFSPSGRKRVDPTLGLGVTTGGGAGRAATPGEESLGARIGRYKLVEKLGEGGCGVVYLAEQEEPVRRRVALKIIKLGMETKSVIARFEAERQALAMMDHPNIARVFDAGATDRGPPYFVMELVRGVRLTEYCDRNRLGLRGRLDLFVQVCHAIQHAHQKGVIHGDIKPSNILVELHDGVPLPKVIDFGISKATEARLTDRSLWTMTALLVGTPAYMSPEQTELGGVDIDTRSDIYSLGVLLYELLTGKTPFDGRALLESGLDQLRRTLREVEPPRPSARLRSLAPEELRAAAEARGTEARRLEAALHGDLDWVVTRALEKDRRRRYETANGLATDVLRYLHDEPVVARPPSRLYRFRKLVSRNRVVFAAGGAVAAALVAGLGASTWLFLREREARQRAEVAEQQQGRLREEAELRGKTTQAALLVSLERFEEADALLGQIVLHAPTVEGAAVFRAIGEWHAAHARWAQAADRFERLLQVDRLEGWDVTTLDFARAGPPLAALGDAARYERFRREAVARFAGTNCPFTDRIVKVALLVPADAKFLETLRPIAEASERSFREADTAGDSFQAAWRALSLALWHLRTGQPAEAEAMSRRCLAYAGENLPRAAAVHGVGALALHELGRVEEARAQLQRGRETLAARLRDPANRGNPVHGFWFDWDFAQALLDEAARRIE